MDPRDASQSGEPTVLVAIEAVATTDLMVREEDLEAALDILGPEDRFQTDQRKGSRDDEQRKVAALLGCARDHSRDRVFLRDWISPEAVITDFAIQIPWWVVVPVLIVALLGAWKLAKLLWAAISN